MLFVVFPQIAAISFNFDIFIFQVYISKGLGYGYDSGSDQGACGTQYRTRRMHQPPCDLTREGYCAAAGSTYPWHAVKRFVRENQGLMRRMYGDQRHINVLRAEFVEDDDEAFGRRYAKEQDLENELYQGDESEARFLQDSKHHEDILNTKFIFSDEPNWSVKLGDLKSVPHFTERLTTVKPTTSNGTQGDNQTDATVEDAVESTVFTERTTDEATTDTTVNQVTAETVTEAVRTTEKPGAVLFQDMEDEEKPSKIDLNYKLKGV